MKFATQLIYSDEIVLEYFEPKEVINEGIISISRIVYGYRSLDLSIDDPLECSVNINCSPEGDNWQGEKTSVAKIIKCDADGCTGTLINNTREDGTLYFLTANHCCSNCLLDAITNPDASDWLFYWNYESPGCDDVSNIEEHVTCGATVVANNSLTDFALLKLLESPYNLEPKIIAYYSGWDRQEPSGGGVCIHHPYGYIKKISTTDLIQLGPSSGYFTF